MMTPLKMRDLARCLLTYEASVDKVSGSKEPATVRVYEKLRQSLIGMAGVAGFYALALRALALAKEEAPGLNAAQVTADGSLVGVAELGPQIDKNKNQAGEYQPSEGGVILIARLFELLLVFLGESLTLRLLQDVWPAGTLDRGISGKGGKS
jgi:hypothetical protein